MSAWTRVSPKFHCPICDKPDWCTYSDKGTCCMRVHSETPMKNGGWWHPLGSRHQKPHGRMLPDVPPPTINVNALLNLWRSNTTYQHIHGLAHELGVASLSLSALQCCWAFPHKAYGFPMRDGEGNAVGIRLRSSTGRKWAVKGSHQGLFIPAIEFKRDLVWICEGPTDTAAAITLGLWTVGRPNCSGGVRDLCALVRRLKVPRAVIVSDKDKPGVEGARLLSQYLPCPSATLVLPAKDMRAFVNEGGNAQILGSLLKAVIWTNK